MELIAHRGCADEYPENTLHALERASRRLPAVELDVRRCGSGELVVFHDETVDRVTDRTEAVADLDWTDLRELAVLDSDEGVPLLSEALAAVPPSVSVQVELKETGVGADAATVVAQSGREARFTSFVPEALAEVREADPDASLGYLFGGGPGVEGGLDTARELDCDSLHPHADLCIGTDVVERAHADGMDVIAWGADSQSVFEALRAAGADGATADSWTVAGVEADAEDGAAVAD
ncbi:glycerophosphodiester phosphodiesterase [Halorussus sp. MSC15.2]|uniref:glycerophosphodiester phosphodiesterase n=1 Tax=Halorussus sp. MSC15.2 TaxID=2283638 RepID=UPI0013D29AB0|nr:glycerophosphodiester phosphodiesterase [Halorussus sp. MSC15.2]NEU56313.1 glycerophosphodiester phosphodiesterase [Halorussus sp. MSC15.2]